MRANYLVDVAANFKAEPHQIAALNDLQTKIPSTVLEEFAGLYTPSQTPKPGAPLTPVKNGTTVPVYQVKFSMAVKRSGDLLEGVLEFICDEKVYNTIRCTSSVRGRQYSGAWNIKGGLIPPTSVAKAKTGAGYTVKTDPIYMPNVIGVSGNFYQIFPFQFQTDGAVRGDFGIHNDANAPGSLGCIVATTDRGWTAIQREFKKLEGIGVKSVELIIEYS